MGEFIKTKKMAMVCPRCERDPKKLKKAGVKIVNLLDFTRRG